MRSRVKLRWSVALLAVVLVFQVSELPTATAATGTCGNSMSPTGFTVTLCITAPASGAIVSGPVAVTATMEIGGTAPAVNGITYLLDEKYLLFDAQAPYLFTMHTYLYAPGLHTLTGYVQFSGGYNSNLVKVPLTFLASAAPNPPAQFTPRLGTPTSPGAPLNVAVVGDGPTGLDAEQQVVNLIGSWNPNLVLSLGDVYTEASPEEFSNWYGENGSYYNRFFSITNPSVGNHEYTVDANARAYFNYWGNVPHYFSYTVGNWHFVSLDNTTQFGQTTSSSAQYQWLAADLQANTAPCTIVAYHRPVYSVDLPDAATDFSAYWQLLASHHVALVVDGHSHNYQRWVPLDGNGNPAPGGTTEIIAGTGGQWISPFDHTDSRLAAGFDTTATAWGAVKLQLNPNGATYSFVNISGQTEDYASSSCGPDTVAPSAPTGVQATAVSGREVDLTWVAATDNAGVASYEVQRSGAPIATLRGDATAFQDTNVLASTSMAYSLVAIDAAGNRSAASTPVLVSTPAPAPTYVQSGVNATGSRLTSVTIPLAKPVRSGDLLVGWFGQYDGSGQVLVSDNVNGAWTRVGGEAFTSGKGDIALYYVPASAAAGSGLTVTVSASASTYLSGMAAEYWGVAAAGPLATYALGGGQGTSAVSGTTASVPAGSLVFSGLITGGIPGAVTPGSSAGVPFVIRAARISNSVVAEDVSSSAAGAQRAAFTLASATDWYVASAVFRAPSVADTVPPSSPTGVSASATSSTSVKVTWLASTDNVGVTGYSVYRNGVRIADVPDVQLSYVDGSAAAGVTYSYTVVAFDAVNNRSAPSVAASVTTPALSARYVQSATMSTGSRVTSVGARLASPVAAGDLLVGWFGQYDSAGTVAVSDDVNGVWTRVPGTTFSSGAGDIALYYKENAAAAPSGVTVIMSVGVATYLQGVVDDYGGVSANGSLLASSVAKGFGTAVDSGTTAAAPAGSLVVAAMMTGGSPGSVTPGSSNGLALTSRIVSASGGLASADVLLAAAGAQRAAFTLASATDWYVASAVFRAGP